MLSVETHCISLAAVPVIGFLIQSCRLLKTFVEDITKDVSRLIEGSPHSSDRRRPRTKEAMAASFAGVIQNHSTVKQLGFNLYVFVSFFSAQAQNIAFYFRFVDKFNDCYEFIIIDISLWANLTICSTLLTLQFEMVEYCFHNKIIVMEMSNVNWWLFPLY